MSTGDGWITLVTTPPASQSSFDRLVRELQESNIEIEVELNAVRQCERDPAAWLRVQPSDFALASELARQYHLE